MAMAMAMAEPRRALAVGHSEELGSEVAAVCSLSDRRLPSTPSDTMHATWATLALALILAILSLAHALVNGRQ